MPVAVMPDRWGEGKLFAFSGLDGKTDRAHTLVGSAITHPVGIMLHLRPDVKLSFGGALRESDARMILGDAVDTYFTTTDAAGRLRFAFADCGRLVGEIIGNLSVELEEAAGEMGFLELAREPRGEVLRWCLALSPDSAEEASHHAREGLAMDLDGLLEERMRFVGGLDTSDLDEAAGERTFRKCAEVLKLNVRAAEGQIGRRWTTPDVWPHRHMWLWDSAFHAVGWRELDGEMAQDAILAVIEQRGSDGKIDLCQAPEPMDHPHTQPPILAWGAWRVFEVTGDESFLARCYEPLGRFINWLFANRDANDNGLLEWKKEFDDERCRCGESGWDNSPRFDRNIIEDHVDLNSYVVREMQILAQMAEVLGKDSDWRERADSLAALVDERLWHEETGLYFDRGPGEDPSEWMTIKSGACFLPMIAAIPSRERARRMVAEHLTDESEFWAATPVPTVALDEPEYSDDMWRGPAWMNNNYLIWEGLKCYGFEEVADELRRRSLRSIRYWYEKTGGIYEYYDPRRETPPAWLHRKGGVGDSGGAGFGVISDYGWTAAMYIAWAKRKDP